MTPNSHPFRPTVGDIALTVILLGLCAWAVVPLSRGLASRANIAQVYQEGHLTRQVDLAHEQSIAVADGHMILAVKEGRIRIARSDCPHQSCRHSGWISRPPQTLICVPNHIVITIPANGQPGDTTASECDTIAR